MVHLITTFKVRKLVQRCLGPDGCVVTTKHFRDELANDNLTFEDAWHVLRSGRIFDEPEEDMKTGDLKYRIEGADSEGKWLVIVFTLKPVDTLILITVFSVEAKGKRS